MADYNFSSALLAPVASHIERAFFQKDTSVHLYVAVGGSESLKAPAPVSSLTHLLADLTVVDLPRLVRRGLSDLFAAASVENPGSNQPSPHYRPSGGIGNAYNRPPTAIELALARPEATWPIVAALVRAAIPALLAHRRELLDIVQANDVPLSDADVPHRTAACRAVAGKIRRFLRGDIGAAEAAGEKKDGSAEFAMTPLGTPEPDRRDPARDVWPSVEDAHGCPAPTRGWRRRLVNDYPNISHPLDELLLAPCLESTECGARGEATYNLDPPLGHELAGLMREMRAHGQYDAVPVYEPSVPPDMRYEYDCEEKLELKECLDLYQGRSPTPSAPTNYGASLIPTPASISPIDGAASRAEPTRPTITALVGNKKNTGYGLFNGGAPPRKDVLAEAARLCYPQPVFATNGPALADPRGEPCIFVASTAPSRAVSNPPCQQTESSFSSSSSASSASRSRAATADRARSSARGRAQQQPSPGLPALRPGPPPRRARQAGSAGAESGERGGSSGSDFAPDSEDLDGYGQDTQEDTEMEDMDMEDT